MSLKTDKEYEINCKLGKFDGFSDKDIKKALELYTVVEKFNSKKFTNRTIKITDRYFTLIKECERIHIPVYTQSEADVSRIENSLNEAERTYYVNMLIEHLPVPIEDNLRHLFFASTYLRAKVLCEFLYKKIHNES